MAASVLLLATVAASCLAARENMVKNQLPPSSSSTQVVELFFFFLVKIVNNNDQKKAQLPVAPCKTLCYTCPTGLWGKVLYHRLQKQLFPQGWRTISVHFRQHPLLQNPALLLERQAFKDVHDWPQCCPSVSIKHLRFLSSQV